MDVGCASSNDSKNLINLDPYLLDESLTADSHLEFHQFIFILVLLLLIPNQEDLDISALRKEFENILYRSSQ